MPHAFLPPSGASAWSRCALWPTMNARFPQDDSPSTIEGTAAHWVGWELLADRHVGENQATPEGTIVTGEMIEGGELLCEVIRRLIPNPNERRVEQSLAMSAIHRECFGTPDAWGFDHDAHILHLIDYKFGHRFVDEYFNKQGLSYLIGVLEKLNGDWPVDVHLRVNFTIVQPRCFAKGEPVRTHSFLVSEAMEYFSALREAALEAYKPDPVATTNPACSDCPGRHACSTLQQAAYSDAEYADNRQPHDLTPQAAALELRMLERALARLEARVDGLRELTLANLRGGKPIPYFHLEQSKPHLKWNRPFEEIVALGEMMGIPLAKDAVVTPTQAKKLGVDEAVISAYSLLPTGSLKLVADNPTDARRVFGLTQE